MKWLKRGIVTSNVARFILNSERGFVIRFCCLNWYTFAIWGENPSRRFCYQEHSEIQYCLRQIYCDATWDIGSTNLLTLIVYDFFYIPIYSIFRVFENTVSLLIFILKFHYLSLNYLLINLVIGAILAININLKILCFRWDLVADNSFQVDQWIRYIDISFNTDIKPWKQIDRN